MSPQLHNEKIDKKAQISVQTAVISKSNLEATSYTCNHIHKKMKIYIGFLVLIVTFTAVQSASFSYTAQNQWPGICVTGNTGRQSPIDIKTDDVEEDDENLSALSFSSEYTSKIDGEFENTCQNVEFTPDSSVNAVMTTPVGSYKLLQFHFHWGACTGEGSEHLVDGVAEEFEAHFVHEKVGGTNASAGDALAVLAVRGKVSQQSIKGIFAELDASLITEVDDKIGVEDIIMSDLFPKNHDYYFYEGSLTTPDCDEIVQWFVFKHTIEVPQDYLDDLRNIEMDEAGNFLTFNFRDTQSLNNREVLCFEEVMLVIIKYYMLANYDKVNVCNGKHWITVGKKFL